MNNNKAMLEIINNAANWGFSPDRYLQGLLEEDKPVSREFGIIEDYGDRKINFFSALRKTMEKKALKTAAEKLHMLLRTRPWSDLYILPSCETRGMFSYSRSPEDGDNKRIKSKLGRVLRRQCGVEEWFIKDHEMSALIESIVGEIWPDSTGVVQLWGDDVIEFYRTYHPDAPCCMKEQYCEFVQLYAQNSDVVSLLCVSSEGHGVAKALVWELPNNRRVLDRVYHHGNHYADGQAIIAKAKSLGCEVQDDWDCRVSDYNIEMDVVVDMSRCEYLPYVDSVRYIKAVDGLSKVHLSNDSTSYITVLTEQNGAMINSTGLFEGIVPCACCGSTMVEDDGWGANGSLYCYDCFHERFFYCQRCNETECQDNNYQVTDGGSKESWCQECVDNHSFVCGECETHFSDDVESHEVSGGGICIHCLEDGSFLCCSDCGEWGSRFSYHKIEENVYCADCVTECCECGKVFANESRQIKDGTCGNCACVEA